MTSRSGKTVKSLLKNVFYFMKLEKQKQQKEDKMGPIQEKWENCLKGAVEILRNAKRSELENFNILDELWANENAHTRILYRLLQNKPLLDSFMSQCLAPAFGQPFSTDCDVLLSCLSENNIDLCIHCPQYSIIIENKINGAMDQPAQIERYIQAEMHNYKNNNKFIYVVYLTLMGGSPSNDSLTEMSKRLLDTNSCKSRFREMSYKEHILPWLKYKASFNVSQNYLISGVTQYIHYLDGRLSQRDVPDASQLVRNYLQNNGITIEDKQFIEVEWCKALRDRLDVWHEYSSESMRRAYFCRQLCDIFHITYQEEDDNDCWHQLYHDDKTGLVINAGNYLRTSPYSVQFSFEGNDEKLFEYMKIIEEIYNQCIFLHTKNENITNTTTYYYEFRCQEDIVIFFNKLKSCIFPNISVDLWNWSELIQRNWQVTKNSLYDDEMFEALKVIHSQWNLVKNEQPETEIISTSKLHLNGRYNWKGDYGLQFFDGEKRVIYFWCNEKYQNQSSIRDELLRQNLSLNYTCSYWNAGRYTYNFSFTNMEEGKKLLDTLLHVREMIFSSNITNSLP